MIFVIRQSYFFVISQKLALLKFEELCNQVILTLSGMEYMTLTIIRRIGQESEYAHIMTLTIMRMACPGSGQCPHVKLINVILMVFIGSGGLQLAISFIDNELQIPTKICLCHFRKMCRGKSRLTKAQWRKQ